MAEKGLDLGFCGSEDLVEVRRKAPSWAVAKSQLFAVSPSLACVQHASQPQLVQMVRSWVFK